MDPTAPRPHWYILEGSTPRPHWYILEGSTPVLTTDMAMFERWFATADRHVAWTKLGEDIVVSTVFLGLDHDWTGHGPPILFETMIFGLDDAPPPWRYATWREAEQGHARACADVQRRLEALPD
jgi:hypothetical protein